MSEQTLVERLRAIVEYKAAWKRDPNGQFERLAEQFYRETGLMAPGKSLPLGLQQDDAERQQRWNEFTARLSAERDATILEAADALSASGPEGAAPHEHDFRDYSVCAYCGQTEAAISGCHHCDEVEPGKRCWWCLRVCLPPQLPDVVKDNQATDNRPRPHDNAGG